MRDDRHSPAETTPPTEPTSPEYLTNFGIATDIRCGSFLLEHSLRDHDPAVLRYALRAAVLAAIDHELAPSTADYLIQEIATAVHLDELCAYLAPIIYLKDLADEPCTNELLKFWYTLKNPDSCTVRHRLEFLPRPQLINLIIMFDEDRGATQWIARDISADIVLRLYGAAIVSQPLFLTAAILSLPDHWPLATETEATRDDADDVPLIER